MANQTFHFDPNGGPLSVELSSGQANPGHYTLMLLESNGIDIVQDVPTTKFTSPNANTHQLPLPAAGNDGRLLHLVASVGLLGMEKAFAVFMALSQDGRKLGEASESGTGTGLTKVCELIAAVSSAPAVRSAVRAVGTGGSRRRRRALDRATRASLRRSVQERTKTLVRSLRGSSTGSQRKRPTTEKRKTARRRRAAGGRRS